MAVLSITDPLPATCQETQEQIQTRDADQDAQQRQERNRLWAAAQEARSNGELANAAQLGEQMFQLEKIWLGEQNAELISSLNWLADTYKVQQDWEKAISRQSLAISYSEAIHGQNDWQTVDERIKAKSLKQLSNLTPELREEFERANQLNQQCLSEYRAGNYEQAIELASSSAAIRRKTVGEEHPDYATTLYNLALFYKTMGDYTRAEPLYLLCKEIKRKSLGEEHPEYATTLNNLALMYRAMGDYVRAEPLYLQCRTIQKKTIGEEHPDFAATLNNLAELYRTMGAYARAEPLYVQCKEIQKKSLGEEHPSYAKTLNNLALLYGAMGDYVRAKPLHLQCKEIIKKSLGEEHPDYAIALSNLGQMYKSIGDFARAEPLHLQCKEIIKKSLGEEHPGYAITLSNLAQMYQATGDYERAESLYLQCKEIEKKTLGEEHPNYATTLNNLAELYKAMGNNERVEPLLLQCKEILQNALGEEHPDYSTTLNNLAMLYKSMGKYERAESFYLKCKEIQQKTLGEEHLDYSMTLHNLSALYRVMGDYEQAKPLVADSLKITFNSMRTNSVILSERQQLAMNQMLRFQLDSYLSLAIAKEGKFQSKAARQVLTWKGATLVRQRSMRIAASDPMIAEQFRLLQSVSSQLASLSRANFDQKPNGWQQQVRGLTDAKENLEAQLSQSSAAFRDTLKEVTSELIQASIPSDAVLIDFLQYTHSEPSEEKKGEYELTDSILAVVARRNGEPQLIDLGPRDDLAESVDRWRETFGMSTQGKQAGLAIRKQVWEPLLESMGDAKTVLVSTDGVLGRMPIAALPGKEAGTYLIEDHRIAMVPVPQLLPTLVHSAGNDSLQRELLLLGDVDYDVDPVTVSAKKKRKKRRLDKNRADGVELEFSALPGAADELAAIELLYPDVLDLGADDADDIKSLKKGGASEAAFREHAGKYRSLHLATHGFFAAAELQSAMTPEAVKRSSRARLTARDSEVTGMNPDLLSGLVFAGANLEPVPGEDDGILTAQEIAFLPLNGVETAVLSACETGLGEVAGGEGLIGIQRAFQVAGVRTTVASLWKVDDQATRKLMELFYTNLLKKKMSRLDALRDAQLQILNDPDCIYSGSDQGKRSPSLDVSGIQQSDGRATPELWAAFQMSGDWR